MLVYKLNKESYEGLEESSQNLYKADGDNFILQVEGATSKDKLNEFRDNNIKLMEDAKKLQGIDMDKYATMLETERKVRDKELIDRGEFDTLISERTAIMENDYKAKLENANSATGDFENKYNTLVTKHEIDGAALKAFAHHKIRPDAHDLLLANVRNTFSVEGGQVIAKSGESIVTGADGNLTVDEFVSNQPEYLRVPNSTGGGNENKGNNGGMRQGNSSADKIKQGLAKRMGV